MVDEFQDTNRAQEELVELLAGTRKNLCVVGDEDQSIYGWRGARAGNLKRFTEHFSGVRIIRLEENYRSTQTILDAAAAVVKNNTDRLGKTLQATLGAGSPLRFYEARDSMSRKPNLWAASWRRFCGRLRGSHVAVLYRTGSQSRAFEEVLRRFDVRLSRGGRIQLLRARRGAQRAGLRAAAVSS